MLYKMDPTNLNTTSAYKYVDWPVHGQGERGQTRKPILFFAYINICACVVESADTLLSFALQSY